MNSIKILSEKEKREILKKLNEQFGIKEIKGKIIMRGGERLFFYSGDLDDEEIRKLESSVFIERFGIYFAKLEEDGEIRLSIDGAEIFGKQITKNIFEISEDSVEKWMQGNEINIKSELKGYVVIKHKEDFLGSGKASENKISNFIPKNRRLKERN